jgi:O-antigen/teichoic acid export membrane protein
MTTRSRLLKGLGANALARLAVTVVQLISVPIFLAHWGPVLYGSWLLLFTLPGYLALSDFGFATAAGSDMTLAAAGGDLAAANRTFSSLWFGVALVSLAICGTAIAVIAVLPQRIMPGASEIGTEAARLTAVALALYAFAALNVMVVLAAYRSARMYPLGVNLMTAIMLAEGVLAMGVVALNGSLLECAIAYVAVRACSVPILYFVLRRIAPWLRFSPHDVHIAELQRLAPAALAAMALPVGNAVSLQGMVLAVAQTGRPADIAVFSTTRMIARFGFQLETMVSDSVMPEFAIVVGEKNIEKATRLFVTNLMAAAAILAVVVIGFLLAGPFLIAVWTRRAIHPPYPLVVGLALSIGFLGLWHFMANLLLGVNRHATYAYYYAPVALAAVVLAGVLVRFFGLDGVVAPMVLLEATMLAIVWSRYNRFMKLNWSEVKIAARSALVTMIGQAHFGRL